MRISKSSGLVVGFGLLTVIGGAVSAYLFLGSKIQPLKNLSQRALQGLRWSFVGGSGLTALGGIGTLAYKLLSRPSRPNAQVTRKYAEVSRLRETDQYKETKKCLNKFRQSVNINHVFEDGDTHFHRKVANQEHAILLAWVEKALDQNLDSRKVPKILLRQSANGDTPLQLAVLNGDPLSVKVLLDPLNAAQRDACLNGRKKEKRPLNLANKLSDEKKKEMIQCLEEPEEVPSEGEDSAVIS